MRDTIALRARLVAALASLPLTAAGLAVVGCSDPPPKAAKNPQDEPPREIYPAASHLDKGDAKADDSVFVIHEGRPFGETGTEMSAVVTQDPYDPDGEEEQGCPSGDWCGSAELAGKFEVSGMEPVDGNGEREPEGLPQTLSELVDHARRLHGDVEAMVDGEVRLTYQQLTDAIDEQAAALVASGIRPGDAVALWAPNIWEWTVSAFATSSSALLSICCPVWSAMCSRRRSQSISAV